LSLARGRRILTGVTALLALAILVAQPHAQEDRLTGLWEGHGKADSAIVPPEGFGFMLALEAKGADEALATVTMQGLDATKPVEAMFDAETGELTFDCDLLGIRVELELVVADDAFTGMARGLGVVATLTGKRISRTKPPGPVSEARRAPVDLRTLTADDWREDVNFLVANLRAKHANVLHTLSEAEWERRRSELLARIGELSPAGAVVALAQLVAAVGDAHTGLGFTGAPFDRFLPVQFAWFSDGLFVTAVDERFAELLAGRVLRIGKLDPAAALAAVRTTFAAENDGWARVASQGKLAQPALLAALGVTESDAEIPVVVAGASGEVAVTVDGGGNTRKWLIAPDQELVPPPLWQQRRKENYWFAPIDGEKAFYFAFNSCAEDPARPIDAFVRELLDSLERTGSERLVVDLRHNSGGNSTVLSRFVPVLAAHPRLAAPGRVRVLIAADTYSSGMMNAHQLRDGAAARLYGEPTGGKPNGYGEMRSFQLPHSALDVYYSTRAYRMVDGDPPAVEPDVRVPLSSEDYFSGVDPVLARALAD
jgi:hypothetical protein